MNKKIKPNRYKPEVGNTDVLKVESNFDVDFCLKCIMIVAIISIVSLAAIFTYDFITQSNVFTIKQIRIDGLQRADREEILAKANLSGNENIFKINLFTIKKQIAEHPWVESVSIKRQLDATLTILIVEQKPLAIVKIEKLSDILINTQGRPFKEYNPTTDKLYDLPIVSGLDLTQSNTGYRFDGPLFNSIMDFLKIEKSVPVTKVLGDKNTGLAIIAKDIYNTPPLEDQPTLKIKLGFDRFKAKLNKAKKISDYIDKNFPDRTICAMDLFNIEKVFIKTQENTALHTITEKGV